MRRRERLITPHNLQAISCSQNISNFILMYSIVGEAEKCLTHNIRFSWLQLFQRITLCQYQCCTKQLYNYSQRSSAHKYYQNYVYVDFQWLIGPKFCYATNVELGVETESKIFACVWYYNSMHPLEAYHDIHFATYIKTIRFIYLNWWLFCPIKFPSKH